MHDLNMARVTIFHVFKCRDDYEAITEIKTKEGGISHLRTKYVRKRLYIRARNAACLGL